MNQVATMLTNLLSNRRSLETLQSYKKYCDPVIDDSEEEILTIEENTQAVDLPSLYDKYCNNNQELSIIEDSVCTASGYDLEEHNSDNLQVYQTDGDSEYEEEYQEDFDDGECGSSRCSYSGHDISAVQYGNERGSRHNQRNTGSCDEAYLHSETSHLSKAEGGEDADYDEDWVGDGQEELDETSECASLCLSTASSCATSSNSSQSRMREERTQNIHYTLPPRQLMSSSSPPVRIAASMKRKNFDKTQIRPSYLTKRSPHLDCSSSTEFILLSRRPCYRSTHTTHRGTGACASVRCVTNQRDTIQTTGRLPNSVYVRASLTSTTAAARSSTHSPWREEAESAPSPSTVGHIYNSGKLEYLKKRISGLAYDKGSMHQTSSGRNIEDSLRRQVIDLITVTLRYFCRAQVVHYFLIANLHNICSSRGLNATKERSWTLLSK